MPDWRGAWQALAALRLAPGWLAAGAALRVTAGVAGARTRTEQAPLLAEVLPRQALPPQPPVPRPWWQAG